MLTASIQSHTFAGSYGFHGSAAVENLQRALTALAQAAGWPAANPGGVDGIVGPRTISAIIAVVANIPEIPSSVKYLLAPALAIALTNDRAQAEAKTLIEQYAAELTAATTAAIARYAGSSQPSSQPTSSPTGPASTKTGRAILPGLFTTGMLAPASSASSQGAPSYLTFPSQEKPFYKNWKTYAIGGGALAALGLGWFFFVR
jgi:lysozyme family protein